MGKDNELRNLVIDLENSDADKLELEIYPNGSGNLQIMQEDAMASFSLSIGDLKELKSQMGKLKI